MVPEIVLTLVLIFAVLLGSLCASLVIEPWRVRPMGVANLAKEKTNAERNEPTKIDYTHPHALLARP
eukprot:4641738-Amphidinium_carterae.1